MRTRMIILVASLSNFIALVGLVVVNMQPARHSTQISSFIPSPSTDAADILAERQLHRLRANRSRIPVLRPVRILRVVPKPIVAPVDDPDPVPTIPSFLGDVKSYAKSLVSAAQFSCLDVLWERESNWRVTAWNSSGAYGIPQALPGSKMASAGSDWQTNGRTQVRWGLTYIKDRYGSSCVALGHSNEFGWY